MTLSIVESVLLGLLQGMTEFLPISSSGHLVLVETLLNYKASEYLFFDIVLHVATLLTVCIFFRKRLLRLLKALFSYGKVGNPVDFRFERRFILAIFFSTFVTGILAFAFKDWLEAMRDHLPLVGIAFFLMGILLFVTRWHKTASNEIYNLPINLWLFALIMGLAQFVAICPGISRSGTTVAVALLLGVSRQYAIEYSFLMSIPAILGAALYELNHAEWKIAFAPACAGFIVSLLSGIFYLWLLVWLVRKGKMYQFSWYLFLLGTFVIGYSLW